jgi:hypothetical protein
MRELIEIFTECGDLAHLALLQFRDESEKRHRAGRHRLQVLKTCRSAELRRIVFRRDRREAVFLFRMNNFVKSRFLAAKRTSHDSTHADRMSFYTKERRARPTVESDHANPQETS